MAELDIKDIWAKGKLGRSAEMDVNVDEVVGKRSRDVLYWVKFILWIEFGLNVVSLPFFAWGAISEDSTQLDRYVYSIGVGLVIIYLFYYQFLINSINRFDYSGDVKGSLTKIYRYLKFYILHYKVVVWGLVPVSSAFGFAMSLMEVAEQDDNFRLYNTAFWISVGILVLFTFLFSLLLNFLVNLIYGRKIKRLRSMVNQL